MYYDQTESCELYVVLIVTNEGPGEKALSLAIVANQGNTRYRLAFKVHLIHIPFLVFELAASSYYLHDPTYRERCAKRSHLGLFDRVWHNCTRYLANMFVD